MPEAKRPLEGVRVLDMTSVVLGPYATRLLGDYGADVVKVESPDGDVLRHSGPMKHPRMGHLYLSTNRSKRSVVLDLKKRAGRDALLRLARKADVLATNVRPQAMARLGLGWDDVRAASPRIVYASAVGFSQRGPYAERPAYDDLIQGMAGIPWLVAKAGAEVPRYAPIILADRILIFDGNHGETMEEEIIPQDRPRDPSSKVFQNFFRLLRQKLRQ